MTTDIITPGRLVRIGPNKVGGRDVLELAEALIEEYGHYKGDSGDQSRGFSIHGAIGEAARRICDAADKSGDKCRVLRDEAKRIVEEHHTTDPAAPATEFGLNDAPAVGKDEAITIMREAREATPR